MSDNPIDVVLTLKRLKNLIVVGMLRSMNET